MAWTDIPDSVIEAGKPIRALDGRALRDNIPALAAGDPGAPPVKAGWVPYDMVAIGDGADGAIWDFSIDGAVSTVNTPDFEDGFDYILWAEDIKTAAATNFNLEYYLGISGTWNDLCGASTSTSTTLLGGGMIAEPSLVKRVHSVTSMGFITSSGSAVGDLVNTIQTVTSSTSQKITKARLRLLSSSLNAGKIKLYKRGGFVSA